MALRRNSDFYFIHVLNCPFDNNSFGQCTINLGKGTSFLFPITSYKIFYVFAWNHFQIFCSLVLSKCYSVLLSYPITLRHLKDQTYLIPSLWNMILVDQCLCNYQEKPFMKSFITYFIFSHIFYYKFYFFIICQVSY